MVIEEITFYTLSTSHTIYGISECSIELKNGALWLKVQVAEPLKLEADICSVEFLGIEMDMKVAFMCENRFIGQIKRIDSYMYSKNI